MRMWRRLTIWTAMCVTGLCMASPVVAQEDTGQETFSSTTSTTTTSSAMVTALGVITIVAVTPKPQRRRALRIYLEQNSVAVLEGMSTGGGQQVADLSGAFGAQTTEEAAAFGEVLRSQRATLGGLLADHHVTDEEVELFISTVYAAMLDHDALSSAVARIQG